MSILTPVFGFELEFFVRLKDSFKEDLKKRLEAKENVPAEYRSWNFEITNRETDHAKHDAQDSQRKRMRDLLKELMKQRGLKIYVNQNEDSWQVTDEPALSEDKTDKNDYWRVEIISPALGSNENWQEQVHNLFKAFSEQIEITTTKGCSHHVHVTPGTKLDHPWFVAEQLAKIYCGVMYWENALFKVMPPYRKRNTWCRPLAELDPKYSTRRSNEKYTSTNFTNVLKGCGTVEFRRQGWAKTADQTIKQVGHALGQFTAFLVHCKWQELKNTKSIGTPAQYIEAVLEGMRRLPANSQVAGLKEWLHALDTDNSTKDAEELVPDELARAAEIKKNRLFDGTSFAGPQSRPATPTTPTTPGHTVPQPQSALPSKIVSTAWPGSDTGPYENPWAEE
ncbi:hypothetical protein B0T26DRAFT_679941 [Lasiosphaeria miniovina]|uniref:Amidoligase enzyme n=1 Tax=Lasiosphaeria miniovina TaxID=1954250 RepID=A0AA39ZYY7_9PEZI|nr:uncharacterized protein B0T26DRAFT_679941 [Lasiosphaeria miniovina]KAK0706232.1 hypothetical protein B0T26DRAFT_679941 [Lasiosphaeria miniovina]